MEPEDPELNGKPSGELEPWVQIQSNTFTNWVNDKLRILDLGVQDLAWDFRDGQKLCKLVEVLRGGPLGGRVSIKPNVNRYEARSNLTLALNAVTKDGVKLVNIGAEDIAGGNLKLILGMIWTLIRRYQIGSQTRLPPKKLMLSWVNAVLHPFHEISNFSADLNDGIALHGIIDYCRPGSCPNWPHLSRSDRLSNCRNGMNQAQELFGIPLVVSPEDFASHHLDELSGMTYMSYFMAEGAPGFKATLEWARMHTSVANFDRDWNNGYHLSEIIHALGGTIPGWPNIDTSDWKATIKTALDSGKDAFGLSPVITAVDFVNPEVDHIGVMAYIAWLQQTAKFRNNNAPEPVIEPEPVPIVEPEPEPLPPPPPPEILAPPPSPPAPSTAELTVEVPANWRIGATCTLLVSTRLEGRGDISAVTRSPSGGTTDLICHRVDHHIHHVTFSPNQKGVWDVRVLYEGREAEDNPFLVNVFDPSLAVITRESDTAKVGQTYSLHVNCRNVGHGDISAHIVRYGEIVPCHVTSLDQYEHTISFEPHEIGTYSIALFCGGAEIPGAPKEINATTPSKVRFGAIETIGQQDTGEEFDQNKFLTEAHVTGSSDTLTDDGRASVNMKNGYDVYKTEIEKTPEPDYAYAPVESMLLFKKSDSLSETSSSMSVDVSPRQNSSVSVSLGERSSSLESEKVYVLGAVKSTPSPTVGSVSPSQMSDIRPHPVRIQMTSSVPQQQQFHPRNIPYATMQLHGNRQIQFGSEHLQAGSYATVSGMGTQQQQNGKFIVSSFLPSASSNHTRRPCPVHVKQQHAHITIPLRVQAGTPVDVQAKDVSGLAVTGPGITKSVQGKETSFEIDTRSAPDKNLQCIIRGPSGKVVGFTTNKSHSGIITVLYIPTEIGIHKVELVYDGMEVNGSPYEVVIHRAVVYVKNLTKEAFLGRGSTFHIDASEMNKGTLEIDSDLPIREYIKIGPNFYQVTFVPRRTGKHDLIIKYNNVIVDGCPYEVDVKAS